MTSNLTNLSVEDVKGEQDEEYEESDVSGSESEDDEEVPGKLPPTFYGPFCLLASIIKDVKRKAIRAELRDCVARLTSASVEKVPGVHAFCLKRCTTIIPLQNDKSSRQKL